MVDIYDPFRPYFLENPDFNRADERSEVERMLLRDDLTQQYLNGLIDTETLFDAFAEHGIDPLEWVEEMESQVERIVSGGVVFTTNENGLFLPER